jgi:ankyrin repeat protein
MQMACKALIAYFFTALTRTSGRFLWVYYQLEYLCKCLPGCIRHALDDLPETLDATYERMLQNINKTNWESAQLLLLCVAVVSRPLRVEELAEFLAFDFSVGPIPKYHKDWCPEDPVEAVLSTCSALLTLVNVDGSQIIQYSHFSVKEFLTSSRIAETKHTISRYHISLTPAHALLARACLAILLYLDKSITKDDMDKFPLAKYAAEHWFEHVHVEDILQNTAEGIKELFDESKIHLAVWLWIYDPTAGPWKRSEIPKLQLPVVPCGTPLHYAAFCGLRNIVKLLVTERLQDVDFQRFDDGSPLLHPATRQGHAGVAQSLIQNGVDTTSQDKRGTPLYWASEGGHIKLAQFLVQRGADATAQNEYGWTPLHEASEGGHTKLAQFLVEQGADPTTQNKYGWTPLHDASEGGHIELAQFLVRHGADATAQDEGGWTPLHGASEGGHIKLAQFLVEKGADVAAQTEAGWTPLGLASEGGQIELAQFLVQHGADTTAQEKNGWTPLHRASNGGHIKLAQFLVEHGADATAQTKDGWTPLHLASKWGYIELVRFLVEHGADATVRSKDGCTPLHEASSRGHIELAQFLVQHGADVTAQNVYGWTPLHGASSGGHVELVQFLVQHSRCGSYN